MDEVIRQSENVSLKELVSFQGKQVLVTGAASGIGQAISKRFAEGGANLILLDRDNNEAGLDRTISKFVDQTKSHLRYLFDISNYNNIKNFWDKLPVLPDILVNNVGIYPEQNFSTLTREDYQKTMSLNYESAQWMSQFFINKSMNQKKGGTIVNISSIEAFHAFKNDMIVYGVSKAAISALTEGLARNYGRNGFRINTVVPGAIRTPGTEKMALKALSHMRFDLVKTAFHFQYRLSDGHWGKADDVAKAVIALSGGILGYSNGSSIYVDNGFHVL